MVASLRPEMNFSFAGVRTRKQRVAAHELRHQINKINYLISIVQQQRTTHEHRTWKLGDENFIPKYQISWISHQSSAMCVIMLGGEDDENQNS